MTKKIRARTERRSQDRAVRRNVATREKLALQAPGGSAAIAIEVSSVASIEVKARSERCVRCGGELELQHHVVAHPSSPDIRRVDLVCRLCHAPRSLHFRVRRSLPS